MTLKEIRDELARIQRKHSLTPAERALQWVIVDLMRPWHDETARDMLILHLVDGWNGRPIDGKSHDLPRVNP